MDRFLPSICIRNSPCALGWLLVGPLQPPGTSAIALALRYLVTSVADDPGRGQGLSTTMEQVVGTRGRMVVRSGSAKVSIEEGRKREENVPELQGTIVALSLPLHPG